MVDPALNPAIFVLNLQDANKKLFFCLLFFEGTLHHFSRIKVIKKLQNSRIQGFLLFSLDDRRIRIRIRTSDERNRFQDAQHWTIKLRISMQKLATKQRNVCGTQILLKVTEQERYQNFSLSTCEKSYTYFENKH
jgi:hypothetical protein